MIEISRDEVQGARREVDVEELSAVVVDVAFRIHKEIGPGLLESVYESVLARALAKRGLRVERKKVVSLEYDGMRFDVTVHGVGAHFAGESGGQAHFSAATSLVAQCFPAEK